MDPAAASTMRQLQADVISLCLGIHSYDAAAFSLHTYAGRVPGFIANMSAVHRDVPVPVITSVLSLPGEETPNAVGSTLRDYRTATAEVDRHQRERGDHQIHGLDGESLLSAAEASVLMPDILHPNSAGRVPLSLHGAHSMTRPGDGCPGPVRLLELPAAHTGPY